MIAAPTQSSIRGMALLAVAAFGGILTAAAWMSPDPRRHGSHEQLGLPPCGMVVTWGWPCPTCGMCTSFSLAIRGRWFASIAVQPAGFCLFLATLWGLTASIAALIFNRAHFIFIPKWSVVRWSVVLATVLLAGWIYKLATWTA